jgi:AraC-like DNA-binding protein
MLDTGLIMSRIEISAAGLYSFRPRSGLGPFEVLPDVNILIWMSDGTALLDLDGDAVELSPRTVVLPRPGSVYEYRWEPNSGRLGYLHFSGRPTPSWPVITRLADDDVVPALLRHLFWLALNTPTRWTTSAENLLVYVLEILESGASGTRLSEMPVLPDLVRRTIEFVADQWTTPPLRSPSLAQLAAAVGVSPEYLSRVFARELGIPPLTALRTLRLWHAARILRSTDATVRAVGEHCGFDNEFHFSTVFARYAGGSPRAYRAEPLLARPLPRQLMPLARYFFGEDMRRNVHPGDAP